MILNRNAWPDDWRAEYEALVEEVIASDSNTHRRLNLYERLLDDAVQAHRPWAREMERACLRAGLAGDIKRWQDRHRVAVAYDGRLLNQPRIQGRKVRVKPGVTVDQRELIELWTWDQIWEKRAECLRMARTYDDKAAYCDRLLALRDLAPDAHTPEEAARLLNIDLDSYLASAA